MKITAVTIGIGEPYLTYAQKGCKEVERLLNIETKIVTNSFLNYCVGTHEQEKIWSLKFSLFDIFPDIEAIMYFDVDWRPLQKFDILDYCSDKNKIYFTPDHSDYWFIQELEKQYGLKPGTYVNAGWFVASREYKHLFNYCRDNFYSFSRSFYGDQCILNQVFKDKITIADARLNVLNAEKFTHEKILGLHNRELNYKFYDNV